MKSKEVRDAFLKQKGLHWSENIDAYVEWLEGYMIKYDVATEEMSEAKDVIIYIASRFGKSLEDIRSESKKNGLPAIRRLIGVVLYDKFNRLGMTIVTIGKLMNRDHSSVMHYVRTRYLIDMEYLTLYNRIMNNEV